VSRTRPRTAAPAVGRTGPRTGPRTATRAAIPPGVRAAAEPTPAPAWADPLLSIAGGVVCTGLAAVSAVYEVFLTPLRWHTSRVPLALLLAVAGNVGLVWLTRLMTGRTGVALVPAAVWTVIVFVAAGRTHEGDLVLTGNNWVGTVLLLVGPLSWGCTVFWLVARPLRKPPAAR